MEFPENSLSNASYQYVYRVPSPPRIFVPPPIQTSIGSATTLSGGSTDLKPRRIWPNTSFLTDTKFKNVRMRDYVIDWTYSERQTAQEILPFLYLGPLAAARDKSFLQSKGITLVLGVRRIMDAFMINPKAPRDLGLEMQFVDIKTEADLMSSFTQLVSKVNEHLERRFHNRKDQHDPSKPPGRVLIFCESGNERSATAVAAYLMTIYGIDVVEAIQIIQGQRFCVNIDDAARNRLDTYSNMLKAQIDVLEAETQGQGKAGSEARISSFGGNGHLDVPLSNGKPSRKRMLEEDNEMDDKMELDMDSNDRFKRDVVHLF